MSPSPIRRSYLSLEADDNPHEQYFFSKEIDGVIDTLCYLVMVFGAGYFLWHVIAWYSLQGAL